MAVRWARDEVAAGEEGGAWRRVGRATRSLVGERVGAAAGLGIGRGEGSRLGGWGFLSQIFGTKFSTLEARSKQANARVKFSGLKVFEHPKAPARNFLSAKGAIESSTGLRFFIYC